MQPPKIGNGVTMACALLSAMALAQVAPAQDAAAPPTANTDVAGVAPARPSVLSVRLPPNARLRLDFDARDEDILGIVKSFFRGFKGQSLKELLDWMKAGGASGPTATGAARSMPIGDLEKVAAVQLLSDADLGTMLRDVNHLRVVVFEMPRTASSTASKGTGKQPARQSVVSFYEQSYILGESGRRMVRADFDEVQMLTVGFPGRGFAVVFQAPGMGVVVRADGYPNFEGVGPFVMATLLRFAPPKNPSPNPFESLMNIVKLLR